MLFPDLGATDYWQSKISLMKSCGIEVQMFDYLETNATENEREEGYDIADYLLKVDVYKRQDVYNLNMIIALSYQIDTGHSASFTKS